MSAGFGIEELKAQLSQSGGIAKANQFAVTLPQIEGFPIEGNELNVMCTATALPGRQILSQDYQIGTTNRKIANGYAITDLSLTFLVANNHNIRQYFEAWQNLAHNQETGEVGYFNDYTKDIQIHTVQKGYRNSLYKKQLGLTSKVPSIIRNRLPKIGPFDLSQDEIDIGIEFNSKKTYTCKLIRCYPTTIEDQQLGNGEEGFMELNVQLSYVDWESQVGQHTGAGESFARSALTSLLKRVI
jgi:hypothetical protein